MNKAIDIKIDLVIDGVSHSLEFHEAEMLYYQLGKIFGKPADIQVIPPMAPFPSYPNYPVVTYARTSDRTGPIE